MGTALLYRLFRTLYSLLCMAAMPVCALYLIKRAWRQPEYWHDWGQRFFGQMPKLPKVAKRIWVHAVSVGEANAIAPLLVHWSKVYPDTHWVVSTTTPTGRVAAEQALQHVPNVVFVVWPYDLPWAIWRALLRLNVHQLWLVETELWPNALAYAHALGVRVSLLNARVSPTTARRMQALAWVMRHALRHVQHVVAQTEADRAVFQRFHPSVTVVGNLKFDLPLQPAMANIGKAWRASLGLSQVLLLASSRDGEEAVLLDALVRAQFFKRLPKASVWIVPRHPERCAEVFELMNNAAVKLGVAAPIKRSSASTAEAFQELLSPHAHLVLGDSMGEMPMYYSVADLAFMGGSWLPHGGQNLIEACAYGCPVWLGPHAFNFTKAVDDAVAAGAAKVWQSLPPAVDALMNLEWPKEHTQKATFAYARQHRGAVLRTFEILREILQ